ncbi:MAG: hypothetical protein VX294_15220 [Candidatus Latescibacterota bacterium]|nr:hypothetical protein [Candidatus Latescibacterota bacterium]
MFRIIIAMLITQNLLGCWFSAKNLGDRTELVVFANDLIQVANLVRDDKKPLVWLGLRNLEGAETSETRAIEDYVVASLVESGIDIVVSTDNDGRWSKEEIVGESDSIGYSIGGRLMEYGSRTYVRLFIVDENSMVVDSVFRGIYTTHVEDEVEERSRNSGIRRSDLPLDVDLHWIVLRNEGGIREPIVFEEGMVLQSGDQLQVRYRVSKDVKVYAFLFSNEGGIESLVSEDFMYSGLLHYGPTENGWIEMTDEDRVYTAYFLAGPILFEENKNEFVENLYELVDQGQVNEFTGLDKQDRLLVDFVSRAYESEISLNIIRGSEAISSTRQEVFVYSDGTRVQSYAEQLKGVPLIMRAVSFRVQ